MFHNVQYTFQMFFNVNSIVQCCNACCEAKGYEQQFNVFISAFNSNENSISKQLYKIVLFDEIHICKLICSSVLLYLYDA